MAKKPAKTVLVVEDDPGLQSQIRWCLDDFEVVLADSRESAIAQFRRYEPQVVTLDMGLPPDPGGTSEGLATLKEIRELSQSTKVIVVTGNDDRDAAVTAVGLGAYDFYLKPVEAEVLSLIVNRAAHLHELEQENAKLARAQGQSPLDGVIASSAAMMKICRTIEKVAPADVSTLILGESGTGKEVLAKALHQLSPRADKRFMAINCAAIPGDLLESELFGHEKGAFTGATSQRLGKVECADGGTLFLDEIGDLPMSLQPKFLRFLQERVIERVGGREEIPVDVRVVGATHQDLQQMIKDGQFREDLYYRLSEITINIPPLRDREEDAVVLARAFLERFARQQNRKVNAFSQDALLAIESYGWPGNVREMENRIKRAVIMADGEVITAEDLEFDERETGNSMPLNLRHVREEAERKAVMRALTYAGGNMAKAAELLGVSRPTLYDLQKKLEIKT